MYPRTVPVEHYSLAHLLDSSRADKFRILRPGSGEVHGLRSDWVVAGNHESAGSHAGCGGSKGNGRIQDVQDRHVSQTPHC